jgi:hypothetical protein
MGDEPDNLVLACLRRFDQQLGEMRADIRNIASRVGALEQRFSALEPASKSRWWERICASTA